MLTGDDAALAPNDSAVIVGREPMKSTDGKGRTAMSMHHLRARLHDALNHRHQQAPATGITATIRATKDSGASRGRPTRTAFVLLGGGSRGAAQAGALTVLLEAGIVPDMIVAISAGAWNGSFLSVDPTPQRARDLERLWLAISSHDIVGGWPWNHAPRVIRHRLSLYDSAGMRQAAGRYIADLNFADLRVPLRVVAADLIAGHARIFADGPVLPAVIASSAVPGIFPPIAGEQEMLVDGGVNEWAACSTALDMGATRICLVACGCQMPAGRPRNLMQIVERTMDVSLRDSFDRTIFALSAAGIGVLPIFPDTPECSFLDFDHAADLIESGHVAAARALMTGWQPQRGPTSVLSGEPTIAPDSVATAEQTA
jgi:NTE family protein